MKLSPSLLLYLIQLGFYYDESRRYRHATLKLAVIIVHAARTIALDDSPASGR